MKARRNSRPPGVRSGMFWRLGESAEIRPVDGHRLVEDGVDPAVCADQRRERVGVGVAELLDLPVPEQVLHDRVLVGHLLQRIGIGRRAGLRLLDRCEPKLVEQDRPQLRGGVDVERARRRRRGSWPRAPRTPWSARPTAPGGSRGRRARRPPPCGPAPAPAAVPRSGRAPSAPGPPARPPGRRPAGRRPPPAGLPPRCRSSRRGPASLRRRRCRRPRRAAGSGGRGRAARRCSRPGRGDRRPRPCRGRGSGGRSSRPPVRWPPAAAAGRGPAPWPDGRPAAGRPGPTSAASAATTAGASRTWAGR